MTPAGIQNPHSGSGSHADGRVLHPPRVPYRPLFFALDANEALPRHLPCWVVMDQQYRDRYPVMNARPGSPDPSTWAGLTITSGNPRAIRRNAAISASCLASR